MFSAKFTDAETICLFILLLVVIVIPPVPDSRLFTPYPLGGSECWGRERCQHSWPFSLLDPQLVADPCRPCRLEFTLSQLITPSEPPELLPRLAWHFHPSKLSYKLVYPTGTHSFFSSTAMTLQMSSHTPMLPPFIPLRPRSSDHLVASTLHPRLFISHNY